MPSSTPVNRDDNPETAPLPSRSPGLPVLGNTLQFLQDTSGLIDRSYRQFGPVFRLRALWLKYTVISGFEAREFLQDKLDEEYLSRLAIFDPVGRQLGTVDFVLGQSGEKHVRFRYLLSLAYSRQVASPFVPEFVQATRDCISKWRPGETICVMEAVKQMAFEQYCRVMCGQSLQAHYKDCLMVTEYNMNVGGRVWPLGMYRAPWYRAARLRVLGLMHNMVEEKRARGVEPGQPPTIMDTLLRVRDQSGNPLSEEEVACYSMYGFAGSSSYMGRLIAFMLYEILKDAELRQRLTSEADCAFAGGLHDATAIRSLPLLRATYHETLRFHPVSQGMPFLAERDFVFHGKQIKKGDFTVLSQVPMSFSACPFHDPQRFDPARCQEPRNEHRSGAFHPFGIGHRTCTAMGLVELMALTMVATLLHERCFEMASPDYQLKLTVKPLPAPNNDFRIRDGGARVLPPPSDEEETDFTEEQLFATFAGGEDPAVQEAIQGAETLAFAPGEAIVREGDSADAFYIVSRGSVEVTRDFAGRQQSLARLAEGEFFGEIGLLQNIPRTATVSAGEQGASVLRIGREPFLHMVAQSDLIGADIAALMRKRVATSRLLEALPVLTREEAEQALPDFHTQVFEPGEIILREGEAADSFYILISGEVAVLRKNGSGADTLAAVLGPGQYFGETGLLYSAPRNATIAVHSSQAAVVLTLDRAGFFRLLKTERGTGNDLAQMMLTRAASLSSRSAP